MAKQKRRLPPGMTYAEVLAEQQRRAQLIRQAAESDAVRIESGVQTQRAMWLMVVAMADAFGLGPKRVDRFIRSFQAATDEFEAMVAGNDWDYALEKLRQKAEAVSGVKIDYLYEEEAARLRRMTEKEDKHEHEHQTGH